jgi:pimeloyl-ACP methyl ester carboxylesterase
MATIRHVPANGLVFDVRTEGPEEGDPIVLLHGFPQDATSWDGVAPVLAAAGHRVLAPNLRGASPAARPHERNRYRLPLLVADVVAIADELGVDRFHVVGHDWGGVLAWSLAADHPHRLRSATSVSTPHPRALVGSLLRSDQALRSLYVLLFDLPLVGEAVVGRTLRRMLTSTGCPADATDRYVAANADPDRLRAALQWYRAVHPGDLGRMGPSRVRSLLVWGNRDPALGRAAARATERHVATGAGYRFDEVEGGHWLPETMGADLAGRILDHVGASTRTGA